MLHIGCHLSSSKGYRHMGEDALSIKADTFQFLRETRGAARPRRRTPRTRKPCAA